MTGFPADEFVPVADVVKAVGLRGELKLYPLIDWHEPLLDSGDLVWDDGAPFAPESWRPLGTCYVVAVPGIGTREGAEGAVGRMVGFLRSRYADPDFPRPRGGLPFRWLGRPVVTATGEAVGEVDDVRTYGAGFMLVVPRGGRECLIPALAPILRPEDELQGPLVIDPPEGLLDVAGD